MAPNRALAPTFVTIREPGTLPRMASTKFTSRLAMPPVFMRLPAITKKGMAVRERMLTPTKVRCAPVKTEMSKGMSCTMAARAEMPMA